MKIKAIIATLSVGALLTGCFTGVESTPKITYKDVNRQKAGVTSEEETLAALFVGEPFKNWKNGDRFYVTGDRISLVMNDPENPTVAPAEGDTIIYAGSREVTDLTGREVVDMTFTDKSGQTKYNYRSNATAEELAERPQTEIPFTISLETVGKVRDALKGKRLYVKTPQWIDANNKSEKGLKFVEVEVTDVVPANAIYPFKVIFRDEKGKEHGVLMSSGAGVRWSPMEFPSLFSIENPRKSYPQISDANWALIQQGKVADGMTKPEVTLAIGSPANIERGQTHNSAYERWLYTEGRSVMFEDGLVIRH